MIFFIIALGTSLSSISELHPNENFNNEMKILAASIQSKKTIFTQFLGARDLSTEGSLLGRNDSWIQSVPKYPQSNKGATTQELVLSWISMLSLGLLKLPIPGFLLCRFHYPLLWVQNRFPMAPHGYTWPYKIYRIGILKYGISS